MPAFWVRDCRPELSQLDGAVLADVLSPIRSTRAEPGAARAHLLTICWTDVWDNTHVRLPGCCVVVSSADTSSPFTSCLYRLMTWVRLSLASKIFAGNEEKQKDLVCACDGKATPFIFTEFGAYLRLRHCPLCRSLTWKVWASSFHSAGKDPRNTHSHDRAAAFLTRFCS